MKHYKLTSKLFFISFFTLFFSVVNSEENVSKFNVYSGMFDFSDTGKRSTLIGFQHQNEDLNRDTFLGNFSPITGALVTADSAAYIYTGIQANYKKGILNFSPSFTPGLYSKHTVSTRNVNSAPTTLSIWGAWAPRTEPCSF